MKDSYEQALRQVLQYEGGYVNDPVDLGGATNKGIIQRTYDSFRRLWGKVKQSVRNISDEEVARIYREGYWDKCGCDDLAYPVDIVVFDSAINCGPERAKLWWNWAKIGDVDSFKQAQLVLNHRRAHYAALIRAKPKQAKFAKGWENRVRDLERKYINAAEGRVV